MSYDYMTVMGQSTSYKKKNIAASLPVFKKIKRLSIDIMQVITNRNTFMQQKVPEISYYFDKSYYLNTYPDVKASGMDPLHHFVMFGWKERRNPNPWLSTAAYLDCYPDLLAREENPLSHMSRIAVAAPCATEIISPLLPPLSLMSTVAGIQPCFVLKWRNDQYLARDLTDLERVRSLFHTYAVIDAIFPESRLPNILIHGFTLWQSETPAGLVAIKFDVSKYIMNEGELSLTLLLENSPIAVMSFNFFPGDPLNCCEQNRLFISRLQTIPGGRLMVRVVTKALRDVMPQAMLFAAAQGLAQALNMSHFIGVPASRHVGLNASIVDRAAETYDRFWESVGAELGPNGLYNGAIIGEQRLLSNVGAGHKIRTRRKRELKATIRDAAKDALEAHMRGERGIP